VTHVLRGEDHLANTPRQLLVLEALEMRAPGYGHLPLLTGADGTPLSKRTGAQSLRELREAGYSATAICNQLFRLGHSSGEPALLTMAELAAHFETNHLQRASARFDPVQLRHWQGLWAHALAPEAALAWLAPFLPASATPVQRTACVVALQPNLVAASDIVDWLPVVFGGELRWEDPARAAIAAAGKEFYRLTAAAASEGTDLGAWRAASGRTGGAFFAPLRAALTGRLHGPELAPLLKAMSPGLARDRLMAWAQ
jgi:glutamyl/glutaminyl-tRNA synthetase